MYKINVKMCVFFKCFKLGDTKTPFLNKIYVKLGESEWLKRRIRMFFHILYDGKFPEASFEPLYCAHIKAT